MPHPLVVTVLAALASYLVGGIPFGYLVARARGVDIFALGSGNIGATNVGRVLGRGYGVLVFVLDFLKGALPTAFGLGTGKLMDPACGAMTPEAFGVVTGLAAFLGHLFPVYLRFRGGKGVATGAGVVSVLLPGPALAALVVWLAVLFASQYVSLASLSAAAALCVVRLTEGPSAFDRLPGTLFCLFAAGLVLLRHRANVTRLLQGNENRLSTTSVMHVLLKTTHVLALGLWFGTAVFFTFVVGLSLFGSFEALGQRPAAGRPSWFPLPREFERRDERLDGPREQGTRAAGFALAPLFPWYFVLQGACGLLAVGTALGLARGQSTSIHRVRTGVLVLALATVLAGWPLERHIETLRGPRYEAMDAFLHSPPDRLEAARATAMAMRAQFRLWHGLSLVLNLGTVIAVTVGMALAAQLPAAPIPAVG